MALTIPTSLRSLIHSEYLHKRQMWAHPEMKKSKKRRHKIQLSFELAIYSLLDEHRWLPTHISPAAVIQLAERYEGKKLEKSVQRAHGILPGRVDRNVRTAELLEGPELSLDEWWAKFIEGDSTILITKQEHGANKAPADLIPIPNGLFYDQGKSYKWQAKGGKEQPWLSEHYTALTGRQSPWAVEAAEKAEQKAQKAQKAAKKAQRTTRSAAKTKPRGR